LPNMGLIKVLDAESGNEQWVDTSDTRVRESYRQHYIQQAQISQNIFRSAGVDSVEINTQDDYVKPLIKLFKMRESRF